MFEIRDFHFHITSYFHSCSSIYFTTLQLFYITYIVYIIIVLLDLPLPHVSHLALTVSFVIFRLSILPYVHHCHKLTLGLNVPSHNAYRNDDTINCSSFIVILKHISEPQSYNIKRQSQYINSQSNTSHLSHSLSILHRSL